MEPELVATIPSTPVATRNTTPEEVPVMDQASKDYPMLTAAMAAMAESAGPTRLANAPKRVRASLPPPSAFTPLSDPPAESPPLPQGLPSTLANRTSWQGPVSAAGMPSLGVLGKGLMAAPRDRSRSDTAATANFQSKQADAIQEIELSTSFGDKVEREPLLDEGFADRRDSEKSLDASVHGLSDIAGDAARHANLIMQTRRAKIQKWRPASAEKQKGAFGQDPPKRNVIPRLARTLSASRLEGAHPIQSDSLSAWNFGKPPAVQRDASTIPLEQSQASPIPSPSGIPISSADGLNLRVPGTSFDSKGEVTMERVPSSGSNVNGIEWVDWLDEYKKYKQAKIRSEEETSRPLVPPSTQPPEAERLTIQTEMPPQSSSHGIGEKSGTSASSRLSPLSPSQKISPLALEPDVSKAPQSVRMQEMPGTKLSRALSQTGGILQRTVSRTDTRRPPSLLPSNPLGTSLRQSSLSHKGTAKKAKGLGNKIEGWWHSVKTNFQNPAVTNPPVPKILPFPPRNVNVPEGRHLPRTNAPAAKTPSAPPSRRGSVMPSHLEVTAQPTTFGDEMDQHAHALRTATSHTDLARLGQDIASLAPGEGNPHGSASPIPVPTLPHRQASDPSDGVSRSGLVQHIIPVQRAATGLEARRRQPALSLKLDNQMLALPHQSRGQYSGSFMAASASAQSSSTGSRGQESSIGMASGLRAWDQTPSPLQALNAKPTQDKSAKPPSQGDSAEFNKVSVQRHVKHRLTVAKENCDRELQAIISEITAYVENHIQQERQLVAEIPMEEEDDLEAADSVQGPFDPVPSIGSGGLSTNIDLEPESTSLSRGMSLNRNLRVAQCETDQSM